jgi:glutathione S-transferase
MIVVHNLEQSRSQRLIWLLEELDQSYDIVNYARDPATRLAPPELAPVHPLGKSPVIEDDGLKLAETGAIFEYLCARYDRQRKLSPAPEDIDENALAWRYWLHYAEGSAMPVLMMKLILTSIDPAAARDTIKGLVDPQLRLHADYWDRSLDRSGWFAGDHFTAADVMMSFPLEAALARFGEALGPRPALHAYLDKLRARPAFGRAAKRAAGTG